MLRLLLACCFMMIHLFAVSQPADFISVRKKNGRPVRSFYAGSPIVFETQYGNYVDGWVEHVRNDSVLIRVYDIRTFYTNLGVTTRDTITSYIRGFHYTDIGKIHVSERQNFIVSKIDKLLIIGGAGYFVLNLVNGAYLNAPITDKKNLKSLAISLGAVGTGVLISRIKKPRKGRYKIVYVRMK